MPPRAARDDDRDAVQGTVGVRCGGRRPSHGGPRSRSAKTHSILWAFPQAKTTRHPTTRSRQAPSSGGSCASMSPRSCARLRRAASWPAVASGDSGRPPLRLLEIVRRTARPSSEPTHGERVRRLATARLVSASTQHQVVAALLLLYRRLLALDLPALDGVVRAKSPEILPVVLSRAEVQAVIHRLDGGLRLMAVPRYGSGLRGLECARLRLKAIDFDAHQIVVRCGNGNPDRGTLLPGTAHDESVLQRAVKRAVRDAGIHKPATCHTLRHSFASHLWRTGTTSGRSRICWGIWTSPQT